MATHPLISAILSRNSGEDSVDAAEDTEPSKDLPEGLTDAVAEMFEDSYQEKEGKALSTEEQARLNKRARALWAAFKIMDAKEE